MSLPADPTLRVTASGVVHNRDCPSLRNNNSGAVPWFSRYDYDRACQRCKPTLPPADVPMRAQSNEPEGASE